MNSVVIFSGTESSDCVLRGFTITNGEAPEGGGIYGNGTLSTIENNIIIGNNAIGYGIPGSYGWGGGLLDCDGLIQNNIITGNYGGWGGGLLCCDGSIKDNIISYNGWYAGGGMYCCGGEISNNLLVGNRAVYGGALSCCNGIIRNCTVVGNWANGSGLDACNGSISNCIIWKNGGGIWTQIKDCSIPIYSCIEDWTGAGTGNTSADPCFANMGYWQQQGSFLRWVENGADYHLRSQAGRWDPNSQTWVLDDVTSPCIDAGNPGCTEANEPAPNGNRINMGAYGGTAEASKSPANWRSIADLNNDWVVDSNDLKVFVDYWLEAGECIPSDLDRSRFVDFTDFAIFGLQWSYPSASEPSMTFQIDDCNMEAGLSWPVAGDSNEPRFSVWVEGRYIHFEDMMYANCCPDELGLDKEINGNQITLYEIGYGGLCDCMCYFPITATLGPFEDGTYTVEVFDNYGNSLGVVEVTIGGSPEPGMTFQIDDCNMDEGQSWPVAAESNEPRFSVWVEGRYIHFEDMMYANCCPDELELEMTVEDNLITIYEIEYTLEGCRCMCSFPITATLGPFEDGTYTVEVYDNYGNSLGVVEVTIGGSTGPGIIYEIEDCNQEASVSFTAEPPDKTRFTVTVEGLYIHFEDMMVANCCPDELGLEMTVEDSTITIYETEYTPGGCWCICDYPVTAMLGPFEPGIYTLEVYEDYGGFIGSTTVVIDPPE